MSTIEFNTQISSLTQILQSFALNLTKNTEDAKDLFQQTAYRALVNADKFRADTNFKAWIFTIMKNIFINDYRKKSKFSTIVDITDNSYYLNLGGVTQNEGEGNMLLDELNEMVNNLEDGIRIPFVMHYDGYKYQEIADHLHLPLGTVKSRIFFARREMKAILKEKHSMTSLSD
jgi:RNA polymerase sigma-70 factor (ECF subfamily)